MVNYKEYDLYYASLMGGWYIPDNVCDEVVEVYNNNESLFNYNFDHCLVKLDTTIYNPLNDPYFNQCLINRMQN